MYDLLYVKKISFIRTCDMEEIKATDCIIKVFITSGNIKWCSFALRFCASNHKSTWQPLLPSAKGLPFTFTFYHIQESSDHHLSFFTLFPLASTLCWSNPDIYIYIHLDVGFHKVLLLTLPLRSKVGRRNYKPLSFSMSD